MTHPLDNATTVWHHKWQSPPQQWQITLYRKRCKIDGIKPKTFINVWELWDSISNSKRHDDYKRDYCESEKTK